MGLRQRKHPNNHAIGMVLMISLLSIAHFCTFIYVNSTPGPVATMGITACALISKEKPTSRATIATTATPKEQRSKRLAKSPPPVNVNPLIARFISPQPDLISS
jgi:hypothetical protein